MPTRLKHGRPAQGEFWPDQPHVWQHRFYDFNVWSERKRIEKLRYMHRNPVKRGLVLAPEQMALEQLSQLRLSGRRKSKDQSVAEGGDEGAPRSLAEELKGSASGIAPILCKKRKGWATHVLRWWERWATRPSNIATGGATSIQLRPQR